MYCQAGRLTRLTFYCWQCTTIVAAKKNFTYVKLGILFFNADRSTEEFVQLRFLSAAEREVLGGVKRKGAKSLRQRRLYSVLFLSEHRLHPCTHCSTGSGSVSGKEPARLGQAHL